MELTLLDVRREVAAGADPLPLLDDYITAAGHAVAGLPADALHQLTTHRSYVRRAETISRYVEANGPVTFPLLAATFGGGGALPEVRDTVLMLRRAGFVAKNDDDSYTSVKPFRTVAAEASA